MKVNKTVVICYLTKLEKPLLYTNSMYFIIKIMRLIANINI